jgi:hypothetical protein
MSLTPKPLELEEPKAPRVHPPLDLKKPTPTGVWHLAVPGRDEHGKPRRRWGARPTDKPYPWVYLIVYKMIDLFFKIAGVAGGALLSYYLLKRYGIPTP